MGWMRAQLGHSRIQDLARACPKLPPHLAAARTPLDREGVAYVRTDSRAGELLDAIVPAICDEDVPARIDGNPGRSRELSVINAGPA